MVGETSSKAANSLQSTNLIMKYSPRIVAAACIAAITFCGALSASAADKKSPAPKASASPSVSASPAGSKTERAIPFRGTVSAVDQSAKTFTIAGKEKTRVFMVTDRTTITKDGAAATLKDVVANSQVTGSYWKGAGDTLEAKTVKIGAATSSEKPEKGEKASPSPAESPRG